MRSGDRPVHLLREDLNRTRVGHPSQLRPREFLVQLGLDNEAPDCTGYLERLVGLHFAIPESRKHAKHLKFVLGTVGVDLPKIEERLVTETALPGEEHLAEVIIGTLMVHKLRGEPFCQEGEQLMERLQTYRPDLIAGAIDGLRQIPDRKFPTDSQLNQLTQI